MGKTIDSLTAWVYCKGVKAVTHHTMNNAPRNAEEFRNRAVEIDVDVSIFEDGSQEFSSVEDDGHFHVEQFGVRASFDSPRGQESSRREFNQFANEVLREFGFSVRHNGSGPV